MSSRRRIAIVTGTRAEFGLLEPVLRAVAARPRLQLQLIVTGMHLLPKFGRTIDQIRAAGWRVDAAVPMQSGRDDARSEPQALARGVAGIARALDRLQSEIVVVLGDRIEAFAGACAAVTGRRVLAHIHGGDRGTGDVDDMLRNAITRLAHVHLVASQDATDRLRRMGERAGRIHKVGAPGLDDIRRFRESIARWGASIGGAGVSSAKCGTGALFARCGTGVSSVQAGKMPAPRKGGPAAGKGSPAACGGGRPVRFLEDEAVVFLEGEVVAAEPAPAQPYALVVQHPIGRGGRRESVIMRAILAAVEANDLRGVIIYPNSDPGHDGIIRVIRQWEKRPGWHVFRSLPRPAYLRLATRAAVMVGNSSSGIIESASLGLNAVNVGPRQQGRLRCGPNVIDCSESRAAIERAIARAVAHRRPVPGRSVYGDGRAGERIAAILERLKISPRLLQKSLGY